MIYLASTKQVYSKLLPCLNGVNIDRVGHPRATAAATSIIDRRDQVRAIGQAGSFAPDRKHSWLTTCQRLDVGPNTQPRHEKAHEKVARLHNT
jgi:hypothetical protein